MLFLFYFRTGNHFGFTRRTKASLMGDNAKKCRPALDHFQWQCDGQVFLLFGSTSCRSGRPNIQSNHCHTLHVPWKRHSTINCIWPKVIEISWSEWSSLSSLNGNWIFQRFSWGSSHWKALKIADSLTRSGPPPHPPPSLTCLPNTHSWHNFPSAPRNDICSPSGNDYNSDVT